MSQTEIINLLKRKKRYLTSKQIQAELKTNKSSVSRNLRALRKCDEIEFILMKSENIRAGEFIFLYRYNFK